MSEEARADTVGSLLRPAYLREARQKLQEGQIGEPELKATEDRAVQEAIALQQEAGLDVITDGEFRRNAWNPVFGVGREAPFAGYTLVEAEHPIWRRFWRDDSGALQTRAPAPAAIVTEPLRARRNIIEEEYGYLKANTSLRTKYTFPAPSYARAFWNADASRDAYPTIDEYLFAVRDLVRREIVDRALALGCDYLQMDAPNYGQIYTDDEVRAAYEAAGHDIEAELIADAELDNSLFHGVTGVTSSIHICRGNGPGGVWSATGGYDKFAADMFPRLDNIDTLLLEYDSERAGNFEPLRHVRQDTTVVLGLLTTKHAALEDAGDIEARIRDATQYVPLERLALSPQCGFSSAPGGNPLSMEDQRAKLDLVVEIARRVWPR
jgi:5-methyltetrahydropteroyltriglutamate--homocysteine methyltransferase